MIIYELPNPDTILRGFSINWYSQLRMYVFCLSMQSYAKVCKNKYDYLVREIAHTISLNGEEHVLCFVGKVENGNYPDENSVAVFKNGDESRTILVIKLGDI